MIPEKHPHLREMIERQLDAFPDHADYLQTRFANDDAEELDFAENVAANLLQIAGPAITQVCQNYRWFCGVMLEEELHFWRTGRYRLSTFAEADAEVYSNREVMSKSMDGLLASQLWWRTEPHGHGSYIVVTAPNGSARRIWLAVPAIHVAILLCTAQSWRKPLRGVNRGSASKRIGTHLVASRLAAAKNARTSASSHTG
jgi:hypothetical protein